MDVEQKTEANREDQVQLPQNEANRQNQTQSAATETRDKSISTKSKNPSKPSIPTGSQTRVESFLVNKSETTTIAHHPDSFPLRFKPMNIRLFIAIIIGTLIGIFVSRTYKNLSEDAEIVMSFPGELLIRLLKAISIPLMTLSILSSLSKIDLRLAKKIGKRTFVYFFLTVQIGTIIGLIVAYMYPIRFELKPNRSTVYAERLHFSKYRPTLDGVLNIVRSMIPDNFLEACISNRHTTIVPPAYWDFSRVNMSWRHLDDLEIDQNPNIVGLLCVSMLLGMVIPRLNRSDRTFLITFLTGAFKIIMVIAMLIIQYAPIGIVSLIAHTIYRTENLANLFKNVGVFCLLFIFAAFLHFFLVYAPLFWFYVGNGLGRFVLKFLPALLTGFATSSSLAAVPISMESLEDAGIDPRIVDFVVPLGANIHMDGSAIYNSMAIYFLGQMRNREFSWQDLILISLLAGLASFSSVAIPSGGMITILIMTSVLDIPSEDVVVLASIDWLMDRLETILNLLGDAIGCAIIQASLRHELKASMQKHKHKHTTHL